VLEMEPKCLVHARQALYCWVTFLALPLFFPFSSLMEHTLEGCWVSWFECLCVFFSLYTIHFCLLRTFPWLYLLYIRKLTEYSDLKNFWALSVEDFKGHDPSIYFFPHWSLLLSFLNFFKKLVFFLGGYGSACL
jgi:hypothetical protein